MSKEIEKLKRPTVGVVVLVVRNEKLLLGKRLEEHGYGTYTTPAGHLEFGENPEECALRELQEEAGIIGKTAKVICFSNQPVDGAHYFNIGVLISESEGEAQVTAPNECDDWSWFDIKDLPDNLYEMVRPTINKYIEGIFY